MGIDSQELETRMFFVRRRTLFMWLRMLLRLWTRLRTRFLTRRCMVLWPRCWLWTFLRALHLRWTILLTLRRLRVLLYLWARRLTLYRRNMILGPGSGLCMLLRALHRRWTIFRSLHWLPLRWNGMILRPRCRLRMLHSWSWMIRLLPLSRTDQSCSLLRSGPCCWSNLA